ncbi:SMP-30/gluconolactonase/LRE family protein [Tahibacter harae]|uniref:Sugar lactone lactonase YvrE n=1 Tax=Tahibacter harae TaxID=2963937 RepID=A0ABT1QXR6_9GAMM|nr:hypothetical protein [Tahibacter harae]MCQ4167073.1 hypothetical protein [Tahibacter harae]
MIRRIGLTMLLLACAAAQAQQPQQEESGDAITALTKRYQEQPQAHYLAYLLARFNADAGQQEAALDWLGKLDERGWDLGINPRDFPSLQGNEEFRAIKIELQRQQQRRERGQREVLVNVAGLIPEGLAFDGQRQRYLIGAYNRAQIHAVDLRGKVTRIWASDEALSVLGMTVAADGHTLYAAVNPTAARRAAGDKAFVLLLDLADGRELRRLPAPEAGYLNDLCLLRDGRIVASDSANSRLLQAAPGAAELRLWDEPGHVIAANGVACDDARGAVYVAVYNGISRVDTGTGAAELMDTPRGAAVGGIDGLYLDGNSLVGVQNGFGAGRVLRMRLSGDGESLSRVETLESGIVDLNEPTTGALTPTSFVYIANSQIWKWDDQKQRLRDGQRAAPIMLRRVPLR